MHVGVVDVHVGIGEMRYDAIETKEHSQYICMSMYIMLTVFVLVVMVSLPFVSIEYCRRGGWTIEQVKWNKV
jgi:heme/copper-type cytochrome/quinol oxidase subunit 2